MTDESAASATEDWRLSFKKQHRLPSEYLPDAQKWFDPLALALALHQKEAGKPLLVAINGCQGSGKTTLAEYLAQALPAEHQLRVVVLSLDDFYLGRRQRLALAASKHPLFITRGVPGTHDIRLLRTCVEALKVGAGEAVSLPRFDKASDDRLPETEWRCAAGPVDMILLEGWCLGARAQPAAELQVPVNELERVEDPLAIWRSHVNKVLAEEFPPLYELADLWVMLSAPGFDCVQRWREQQEQKLISSLGTGDRGRTMDARAIRRFIQHYQRLTQVCLQTLPSQVDYCYHLDSQRQIMAGPFD